MKTIRKSDGVLSRVVRLLPFLIIVLGFSVNIILRHSIGIVLLIEILTMVVSLAIAITVDLLLERKRRYINNLHWDHIFNEAVKEFKAAPYERSFLSHLTPEKLRSYLGRRPQGWASYKEPLTELVKSPGSYIRPDGLMAMARPMDTAEDMVRGYARAFGVSIRIIKRKD